MLESLTLANIALNVLVDALLRKRIKSKLKMKN